MIPDMTPRQRAALALYIKGRTPRYIAQVLRVSERSVTGWLTKRAPTRADRIRANIAAMPNVSLFKWR